MRYQHRGRHEQQEITDYGNAAISLDHNFIMSEFVGEANGIKSADLEGLKPQLEKLDQQVQDWRTSANRGLFELIQDEGIARELKGLAKKYKEWCRDVLVLGSGGSVVGIRALQQALCHPSHNYFPIGRRQYHSRLFVSEYLDPDSFYGRLDDLELKRLLVNVISGSEGDTATIAQFLFVYNLLQGRLGEAKARESFILTTNANHDGFHRLAQTEGFASLSYPATAAGGLSVFSPACLFPAAMAGIDIEGLLAGARFMDQRLRAADLSQNPAYRLAACYYLLSSRKGCTLQVMIPNAAGLAGVTDWFGQLWAECLGNKINAAGGVVGPAPVRAAGATEQQSQMQLFMAGPADKIVTFLEVEKFNQNLTIPTSFPEIDSLGYLGGHTFAALQAAGKKATAFDLMQAGRPNLTIKLPEINAFTIGQLLYLGEMTVIALAGLWQLNPLAQPDAAGSTQRTYGILGRPGFEARRAELEKAAPGSEKYLVA